MRKQEVANFFLYILFLFYIIKKIDKNKIRVIYQRCAKEIANKKDITKESEDTNIYKKIKKVLTQVVKDDIIRLRFKKEAQMIFEN